MTATARQVATMPTRLLTRQEAANYCGISTTIFDQIAPVRPVALADGRARLIRYDIRDLNDWIDRRKGADLSHDARAEDVLARI